jgi:hypothetical protein
MFLDSIFWLAIGFLPTYGAMELSWRIARRISANKNKTRETEEKAIAASMHSKVSKQ